MTDIRSNIKYLLSQIPPQVKLVAVSKTKPVADILVAYNAGQRIFGENRVQELLKKKDLLPSDIEWHLIGHLQTNKVKYIAEFVDTIESVDSEKLLQEIDRQASKHHRTIKVLLQIKIAEEDTKFGMNKEEAKTLFTQYLNGDFPNAEITGLMGMATFTDDKEQIRKEFTSLKNFYDELSLLKPLNTLSMGMSDDFAVAVECGSNSVRIGSAIFGYRNYNTV